MSSTIDCSEHKLVVLAREPIEVSTYDVLRLKINERIPEKFSQSPFRWENCPLKGFRVLNAFRYAQVLALQFRLLS